MKKKKKRSKLSRFCFFNETNTLLVFPVLRVQQGNTALHLAAAGNHREVSLILVENEVEMDLPNHVSVHN